MKKPKSIPPEDGRAMLAYVIRQHTRPDWLARQLSRQRQEQYRLALWEHCQAHWLAQRAERS